MKRQTKRYLKIILILLLVIVLDLFGAFNLLKGLIIRGETSASEPVSYIRNSFNYAIDLIQNVTRLQDENKRLGQENRKLIQREVNSEEIKKENETLKQALLIPEFKDRDKIFVKVFSNPLTGDQGSFFVNKGEEDGVSVGQIVVDANDFYVGRINNVSRYSAEGLFAFHYYPDLPVSIAGKNIKGVVRSDPKGWILDMIPKESNIAVNDIVLLESEKNFLDSNNNNLNIIIGKVKSIDDKSKGIFFTGVVDPLTDYSAVQFAFILTQK
jgi:cell shape-determining protein MreC